jgi:hypothetical protein
MMVRQTYRPTAADKKPVPPTKPAKAGIAQPEPKAAVKVGLPVSAASSLAKTLRCSGSPTGLLAST